MNNLLFPANDCAALLKACFKAFLRQYKNDLLQTVPNKEECLEIVKALLEAQITARLLWVPAPFDSAPVIERIIPGFQDLRFQQENITLSREVLEPVDDLIEAVINRIIPTMTWDMWTTRPLGSAILLERGIDFRIYEWERLVASGELNYAHLTADEREIEQFNTHIHTSLDQQEILQHLKKLYQHLPMLTPSTPRRTPLCEQDHPSSDCTY